MIPKRNTIFRMSPGLEPEIYWPLLEAAFREDLGASGDITTRNLFEPGEKITARIRSREEGVLSGLGIALGAFLLLDEELQFKTGPVDGQGIKKGQAVLEITGEARSILTAERIALNFLGLLSGIASRTNTYVQKLQGTRAKLLDTRKTLPLYRGLQKYAVRCGGGFNHRMGLHDTVMLKDNHIAKAGSISKAVEKIRGKLGHTVKIEVEVDHTTQLQEVVAAGVDIVLLDNMNIPALEKAVQFCKGRIITEASGGITLETITQVAETGVDYISVGALSHTIQNLDFGLDME